MAMIEVDGLLLPDPRATNPELFDLTSPDSPIVQFAHAFGVEPEDVEFLPPVIKNGVGGQQFVLLTTTDLPSTSDFDESDIPLMIAAKGGNGDWNWSKVNLRLSENFGINILAATDPRFDNKTDQRLADNFSGGKPGVFAFQWIHNRGLDAPLNRSLADDWIRELKNNNQIIVGMPLIWHGDASEMLQGMSQEEAIQALEQHVTQLVSTFPDINEWGVLQEAAWEFQGVTGFEETPWNQSQDRKSIPEFIPRVYRAARQANPNVILDYSDYGIERGGLKSDKVINMIKTINQESVGGRPLIDRIIFEIQTDGDNPFTEEEILDQIRRYEEIGVKVGFEVDVYFEKDTKTPPDEKVQKAIEIYTTAFSAAIKSNWVDQITLWDPVKENSWHNLLNQEAFTPFSNNPNEYSDDRIFCAILQKIMQSFP